MAEYGEWTRKGTTLSDVTAQAEYGVSQEFIIKGIECGKLEYRQGSVWGNPYLRVLRRQLEAFIAEDAIWGRNANATVISLTRFDTHIGPIVRRGAQCSAVTMQ
jgi:hypothetical protein